MSSTGEERLQRFEDEWADRTEEIKEQELSPKQCKRIEDEFTESLRDILIDLDIDFDSDTQQRLHSVRSDLSLALEQARSNYRDQLGSILSKIQFEIQLRLLNLNIG